MNKLSKKKVEDMKNIQKETHQKFEVNDYSLRGLDDYYTQSDWDTLGIDPETEESYPLAFSELQESLSRAKERRIRKSRRKWGMKDER